LLFTEVLKAEMLFFFNLKADMKISLGLQNFTSEFDDWIFPNAEIFEERTGEDREFRKSACFKESNNCSAISCIRDFDFDGISTTPLQKN
jgi:hypothetical protein